MLQSPTVSTVTTVPRAPLPYFDKASSAAQKARFKIGDTLYLVVFRYRNTALPNSPMQCDLPYYGGDFTFVDIELHEVEVIEHCLVRWRYDLEEVPPKYHGFIARDSEGHEWTNQYPLADYGQVSTIQDRRFTRTLAQAQGEPILFINATELCSVLNELDNATLMAGLSGELRKEYRHRLRTAIDTFHAKFPNKLLTRSTLGLEGLKFVDYAVAARPAEEQESAKNNANE